MSLQPWGPENGAGAPTSGRAGVSRGGQGHPSQSLHSCRNLCVSDAVSSLLLPCQEPCFTVWVPVTAGFLCFFFFF